MEPKSVFLGSLLITIRLVALLLFGTLSVAATPTPTSTMSSAPGESNQVTCDTLYQESQQRVNDFTPSASSICLKDDDCTNSLINIDKLLPNAGGTFCALGPQCHPFSKAQAYDWEVFIQTDPQLDLICQRMAALNCHGRQRGCESGGPAACVNQECVTIINRQ